MSTEVVVSDPIPEGFSSVTEGKATILCPKRSDGTQEVFYNPVQELNRDLSIVVLRTFIKTLREDRLNKRKKTTGHTKSSSSVLRRETDSGITICEALSATGLRSIRYIKEIDGISKIIANDIDPQAVETIKRNLEYNKVPQDIVTPNLDDATTLLYNSRIFDKQFDVVDLDPYGSASPFIDGAIQAVKDEGLLCVTCTDLAVLCGNHIETCYSKYGATPTKGELCHENALRIVLGMLEINANRYKRHIVPLVSLSIDFYLRVFVRVYSSAVDCKQTLKNIGHLHRCTGCYTFRTISVGKQNKSQVALQTTRSDDSPLCHECGQVFQISGPIWLGQLYNPEFVGNAISHLSESNELRSQKRALGLLNGLGSELIDQPLYYSLSEMCNVLHITCPAHHTVTNALLNANYQVSRSHTDPQAIKTNAPSSVVWDILRCFNKTHPAKNLSETSPAFKILSKEPTFIADFTTPSGSETSKKKVPMYVPAPEPHWGPKAKAKGGNRAKGEKRKQRDATTQQSEEKRVKGVETDGEQQTTTSDVGQTSEQM